MTLFFLPALAAMVIVLSSCAAQRSQGDRAPVFDTREHPLPQADTDTITPQPVAGSTDSLVPYTVQRGDTLFSISRAHGMTVQELQDINGLTTTNIQAGQTLLVRGANGSVRSTMQRQTTIHDLPMR